MKTKYKILIAKLIFNIISLFRFNKKTNCKRNSINWSLDLSEAIDLSIYLFGKFEHEIVDSAFELNTEKNNCIIDIGANIGTQTLQFANKFKNSKIYSIEPTDYAFKKMQNNIKLNSDLSKRIFPIQAYLTKNKNEMPNHVYSSWKVDSDEIQHLKHKGIKKSTNHAQSISLDDLILENKIENISFIKLDVDGPELNVLKSGQKILSEKKPPIFMELAPYLYHEFGYKYFDLIKYINFLGYNFFTINPIKKIDNIEKFILKINDGSSKNILLK
tara:strand:+ start:1298 stop:2116 length:819 start_codon:yes stop_codon:yes gene_type:complete